MRALYVRVLVFVAVTAPIALIGLGFVWGHSIAVAQARAAQRATTECLSAGERPRSGTLGVFENAEELRALLGEVFERVPPPPPPPPAGPEAEG